LLPFSLFPCKWYFLSGGEQRVSKPFSFILLPPFSEMPTIPCWSSLSFLLFFLSNSPSISYQRVRPTLSARRFLSPFFTLYTSQSPPHVLNDVMVSILFPFFSTGGEDYSWIVLVSSHSSYDSLSWHSSVRFLVPHACGSPPLPIRGCERFLLNLFFSWDSFLFFFFTPPPPNGDLSLGFASPRGKSPGPPLKETTPIPPQPTPQTKKPKPKPQKLKKTPKQSENCVLTSYSLPWRVV